MKHANSLLIYICPVSTDWKVWNIQQLFNNMISNTILFFCVKSCINTYYIFTRHFTYDWIFFLPTGTNFGSNPAQSVTLTLFLIIHTETFYYLRSCHCYYYYYNMICYLLYLFIFSATSVTPNKTVSQTLHFGILVSNYNSKNQNVQYIYVVNVWSGHFSICIFIVWL